MDEDEKIYKKFNTFSRFFAFFYFILGLLFFFFSNRHPVYYALFAERIFLLLSHKTVYLILLSFQYSTIVPALFSINRLYTLFLLHVSFSPTTLPIEVHYNVLLYNLQVHY